MKRTLLYFAGVALFACLSSEVNADDALTTSAKLWKAQDKCALAVRKQFPDYTKESNAKRERAFQMCLLGNNLPPHGSSTPATSDKK
jgi:hypothetical protein